MGGWIRKRIDSYILPLILVGALVYPGWTKHGDAFADQKGEAAAPQNERGGAAFGEAPEYHTPLAGEPLHIDFMGISKDLFSVSYACSP